MVYSGVNVMQNVCNFNCSEVEVRGRREGYNAMCTRNVMGVKLLTARYVRGETVQKEE